MCPICFYIIKLGMIRERVKSGMANAKAKGIRIGRPQTTKENIPPIFYRHYPAYVNGTLTSTELARVCDMSRTRDYNQAKRGCKLACERASADYSASASQRDAECVAPPTQDGGLARSITGRSFLFYMIANIFGPLAQLVRATGS